MTLYPRNVVKSTIDFRLSEEETEVKMDLRLRRCTVPAERDFGKGHEKAPCLTQGGDVDHLNLRALRIMIRAGMLRAGRGWVKGRDVRRRESWKHPCPRHGGRACPFGVMFVTA